MRRVRKISIHAPREGSDLNAGGTICGAGISIHAPREGSDRTVARVVDSIRPYFYPRSPRGERQEDNTMKKYNKSISIHAPREGSDRNPRKR